MISRLMKNKDFWAGMMFAGFGVAAMFIARDYRFGSATRMGPGFFPTVLGGILVAFGVSIMGLGLRSGEKIQGHVSLRTLGLLILSLILFGVLMQWAGFIPALVALVFLSAAAGKDFRFLEILMLTVILVVASAALFIWGLELPYPLFKGF
ncbi:MAG: tripartite tricarboxylate transporter TctB family protein [Deltaproteobacteria bacterium]|nr:tripartite tricarboxylate transporter TctB family protein [Deltaproteobacteria bacterium]